MTAPDNAAHARLGAPAAAGLACAALAAALAVLWGFRPLGHDDLFWHLRTGDWIVQHHAVPTFDPFTFTRLGAPWISHEWGFAMVAWAFDRAFGLRGLQLLTALLALLAGGLAVLRCSREARRLRSLGPVLALAVLTALPVLFLRPAFLAVALLAAFLLALERYRASGRRAWLGAALLVLWAWANVHSNVVFGLGLLALQATEAWLRRGRDGSPFPPRAARDLTLTLAAGALVSLCNPNGARALLFPLVLSRILWGSGIAWDLQQFETQAPWSNPPLLLVALLLGLALLRWRAAAPRWPAWEGLASVGYLALSFKSARFVPELLVVALPLVAREAAARLEGHARSTVAAGLAGALLLLPPLARAASDVRAPVVGATFPVGAAGFLAATGLHARLFHNSNQGGYLLWRLGAPVFWDGRTDVFPSLTREVTTIPFPEVVRHYGVDALLLTEREMRDLRAEVEGGSWGLVYFDDVSAVYLRRDGPLAAALAERELTSFRAFGDGSELAPLAADPERRARARRELAGLLAAQPDDRRALYFAAVLDLAAGEPALAEARLERALALGGGDAVRSALALARRGAMPGARP